MSDWSLSDGPNRPDWEPVRFIDFAGKRLDALKALRQRLSDIGLSHMTDKELAMHAILEYLFTRSTVRLDQARAEAIRLKTQSLPDPGRGRRRRIPGAQRDDMIVMVGLAWADFISHNFPLPPTPEA
ncbi:MAG TPA: hypothetical protein VJM32_00810 [Candidatus Saccharimonadales bacterium]|nr:hypothetical protein [Candidatus Saccharimonadales bacterium]